MLTSEADQLVHAAAAEAGVGHYERAQALLTRALRADPEHLMARCKQAELALLRKDHGAALALLETVLAVEPYFAPAWANRARALWLAGRPADAVAAAAHAVDIQPLNPDFRLQLAQFAGWTGDPTRSRAALAPLLENDWVAPEHRAAAVSALGECTLAEGRFEAALPELDRALELAPENVTARMIRGMTLLRLGRFAEGWADYAAREWVRSLYPEGPPRLPGRPWQGEALNGASLLIADDQGHGDAIQFFRYISVLRRIGAGPIIWRTSPSLRRLFADSAPWISVTSSLDHGAQTDFHCSSSALPRWVGTTLDTIPAEVPYLRAPATAKRPARRGRHIGLVWSGDSLHTRDHLRSIPADLFLALADQPNVTFHSLQHEVRAADRPALHQRKGIQRHVEAAADFADTAALMQRLDLVIAVDTGVAHLAAALGKPVWLVLHVSPDWRWLTERSDSPWYPTMRLFRVTPNEWFGRSDNGWRPVLGRVAAALRDFAAGGSG